MDIEAVRSIVIEEAEAHYHFVDEYGFSKIAREEIVEEGDGVAVGRFRIELQDNTALQMLIDRVCERISDEPRVFMDMREQYGLMYYECVWVLNFKDKTDIGSDDKRRIEKPIEQPIEKTVEKELEPHKEIPPTAEEIEDDGLETRTEDREDQDFDSSQFNEEMFA